MEESGEARIPATLLLGKELVVPIGQESGWAPEPVWTRWRRENITSLSLPGIESRSSSP